jgi:hypothetical protein
MQVSMDLGRLERPGVSGSKEGYAGIDGLGITGASLGIRERGGVYRYRRTWDDRGVLGYQGVRRGMQGSTYLG